MATALDANLAYVSLADGKFDTRYRYVREPADPADTVIHSVNGPSVVIAINTDARVFWRWQMGAATRYASFTTANGAPVVDSVTQRNLAL